MLTSPVAADRRADTREAGTGAPALFEVVVRPGTTERPPAKEDDRCRKLSAVLHRVSADSAVHKVRAMVVRGMIQMRPEVGRA